ncbi:MAG: hypothetical protein ABJB86_22650, partial [Bacteroidota bacterium]
YTNDCNAQTTGMPADSVSPTNNSALSRREGLSTEGSSQSDKRKTWTPKNPEPGIAYMHRTTTKPAKKTPKKIHTAQPARKDTLN